jgi:tRNA U34 5-carboxymethylaminomethyl modifying GTPase MnmE/TrmE
MIVLTKCDLLSAEEVAQSIVAVDEDLLTRYPELSNPTHIPNLKVTDTAFGSCKKIIPVASSTGAGIQRLWTELLACVKASTSPSNEGVSTAVREHRHADLVRRADILRQLHQIKKSKLNKEKVDARKKELDAAKSKSNSS